MTDRELILHIGHGKTATTYVQALLTHNAERLAGLGIYYPVFPRPGEDVLIENWHDRHSFGNALDALRQDTMLPAPPDTRRFVLSDETLIDEIFSKDHNATLETLKRFCVLNEITRVRTVLVVRDPMEFWVSMHSQAIIPADEEADMLHRLASCILTCLETDLDLPGYSREVYNYSHRSGGMKAWLSGVLGVSDDTLIEPVGRDTNRSLAAPEFEFISAVSDVAGESSNWLKIAIKANIPKPAHGTWVPSMEWQTRLVEQNGDILNAINAALPEAERFRIEFLEPTSETATYGMNSEWIKALGRAVGVLLSGTSRELKANQAQVELLTASRDILTKNWVGALDALTRADQHIAELARIEISHPERSQAMAKTAKDMRATVSKVVRE